VLDLPISWEMPSNADENIENLWGFFVEIADRSGTGSISKYYALDAVWSGTGQPNTILCRDEMTNSVNVAVTDKPHSDGLYWSGSIPSALEGEVGVWEPYAYGTTYAIRVNPVHSSGEIQSSDCYRHHSFH